MDETELVLMPSTLQDPQNQNPPRNDEALQSAIPSSSLPPIKFTAKLPALSKNSKSLLQLKDEDHVVKKNRIYSIHKKMRDEKNMQTYLERQKLGSLRLKKSETQEKRPVFKSTKVVNQARMKPVEMRPQLKSMKDEYKLRQESIERFLSHSGILEDYKMLSHLGKGSFSVVALAVNRETNRRFAVKTYTKIDEIDEYKFDNIYREINHLKALQHQNIVNLYHVVKDRRKLLLIMEDGGKLSLAGLLRKNNSIPEAQVRPIFRQILEGIQHCHERKICHRDIKLQNVLIDGSQRVRLIDFGFSAKCGQRLRNFCGTPPYMAPQVTAKLPYFGEPADMWALGVLLYLMLFGKLPFRATSEKELYRLIQAGKFQMGEGVTTQAKQTIRKLLKCNMRERGTAIQMLGGKWLKQDS